MQKPKIRKPLKYHILLFALFLSAIPLLAQDDSSSVKMPVQPKQDPEVLNMEQVVDMIGYPKAARAEGVMGTVWLRVLIDTSGNYSKHVVTTPVHPLLDTVVEKHIHVIRFTPAVNEFGEKFEFWVNIPFKFSLVGEQKKKRRKRRRRRRN